MFGRLLWCGLLGLAAFSLLGFMGEWDWRLELFNHFRMHLVLACTLAVFICMFVNWRLGFAALGVLMLNLFIVSDRYTALETAVQNAEGTPVKVLSLNVLGSNTNQNAVISLIAREEPDIVFIAELTPRWAQDLSGYMDLHYPYQILQPLEGWYGLAAYAKRPFFGETISASRLNAEIAILRADFGDFAMLGVHPIAPLTNQMAADNLHYLKTAVQLSGSKNTPVLMVGDYNATPWSRAFKLFVEAGFKRTLEAPISPTYPVGKPSQWIEIDHALIRGDLVGVSRVLFEDIGSDHYAVRVDIWPQQNAPAIAAVE